MNLESQFRKMAEYNRWMNQNLLAAVDKLDPGQVFEDRGAFFGSVGGTFNHILVGDIIWLKRFALHPAGFASLQGVTQMPAPSALGEILYRDIASFAVARQNLDQAIIDLMDEIPEENYAQVLEYKTTAAEPQRKQFGFLVQHMFNHQTHHRGQITTLLYQLGVDPGVTDLNGILPALVDASVNQQE